MISLISVVPLLSESRVEIKMIDENIVNRAEFQDKLKILYNERSDSNRSLWNKKQPFIVIKFLQEVEECSIHKECSHHHYAKISIPHSTEYYRNMSEIFQIFHCN